MASPSSKLGPDNELPSHSKCRIKCSYQECFRYFSTAKDMKTHKKKEPSHEYCSKCDVDCEDDSDLLIHMIESGRHIVCPMCGMEFKSHAGLEGHIPQTHQLSQNLSCVGCGDKFTRAAGLMQHIESGECKVITQEVFERRLAEKAISKDAWAMQFKPDGEGSIPRGNNSTFSDADTNTQGGVSLLDDENNNSNVIEGGTHQIPQQDYLTPSMSFLSVRDQYPTMQQWNSTTQAAAIGQKEGKDLMAFDADQVGDKNCVKRAWNVSTPAASSLFKDSKMPSDPAKPASNITGAPNTSGPLLSTDPNAHLSMGRAPIIPSSILDPMTCLNQMTNRFDCPGNRCGGSFATIEAFNAHLTSSAHVGGRTVCPACLSRFASTMALVSHCESPSKRCNIRNTANYNQVLREITGDLIGTEGHHIDGSIRYVANDISKPGFW